MLRDKLEPRQEIIGPKPPSPEVWAFDFPRYCSTYFKLLKTGGQCTSSDDKLSPVQAKSVGHEQ